ncbi:PepSY domain-containing protein [Sphingosinicella xenopeptidilytica]|uniref:PepSY domain-containing protein n=1 Tax=Sphingosinicella xenopeptidilytica TaxID=364098 RepID=A0ABW3BYU6_SPHXN
MSAWGENPAYGHRAPNAGWVEVAPYTGKFTETDYMPGMQPAGFMPTLTSFFTLHFGSFGGPPVRWAYFFMGLAGAMLFYTGNLLWIESRRKKERKAGAVTQSRSTIVMGALTVGVTLGCVAGISLTIAAAKWLPGRVGDVAAWHSWIYYLTFLAAIGWAFARGAARAGWELLAFAGAMTLLIPITSLLAAAGLPGTGWSYRHTILVDVTALAGAAALFWMARIAYRRAESGPRDSVWGEAKARTVPQA